MQIFALKEQIAEQAGIPVAQQRLFSSDGTTELEGETLRGVFGHGGYFVKLVQIQPSWTPNKRQRREEEKPSCQLLVCALESEDDDSITISIWHWPKDNDFVRELLERLERDNEVREKATDINIGNQEVTAKVGSPLGNIEVKATRRRQSMTTTLTLEPSHIFVWVYTSRIEDAITIVERSHGDRLEVKITFARGWVDGLPGPVRVFTDNGTEGWVIWNIKEKIKEVLGGI